MVILALVMGLMLILLTIGIGSLRQALLILGSCHSPRSAA